MVVHEIDINIVNVTFYLILFNNITAKQQKSSGSLKQYGLNMKTRLFEGKHVVRHVQQFLLDHSLLLHFLMPTTYVSNGSPFLKCVVSIHGGGV